jgi:hypothetical protein
MREPGHHMPRARRRAGDAVLVSVELLPVARALRERGLRRGLGREVGAIAVAVLAVLVVGCGRRRRDRGAGLLVGFLRVVLGAMAQERLGGGH